MVTSRALRWTTLGLMVSAIDEHTGQPASYAGPNMKWYMRSCERPSKSSGRVLVPPSVSKL
jgi:hypothetical protein